MRLSEAQGDSKCGECAVFASLSNYYLNYEVGKHTLDGIDRRSWEDIELIAKSGKAADWFFLGDEKNITLNSGEKITVVIVGFNPGGASKNTTYCGQTDPISTRYGVCFCVFGTIWGVIWGVKWGVTQVAHRAFNSTINTFLQRGRKLSKYNGTTFEYNAQGQRIKKNSITFTYDSQGRLLKQSNGLEFYYDTTGLVGLKYNNINYVYRKDVQGNIIAILDSSGNIVVEYSYDAWGNLP